MPVVAALVPERLRAADEPAPTPAPIAPQTAERQRHASGSAATRAAAPPAPPPIPAPDISAVLPAPAEIPRAPVSGRSILRPALAARVQAPKGLRRASPVPEPPAQPRQEAVPNPPAPDSPPVRAALKLNKPASIDAAPEGPSEAVAAMPTAPYPFPDSPEENTGSHPAAREPRPLAAAAQPDLGHRVSKPESPLLRHRLEPPATNSIAPGSTSTAAQPASEATPALSPARNAQNPRPRGDAVHPRQTAAPAKTGSRITIGRIDVRVNNRPGVRGQAPKVTAELSSSLPGTWDMYPLTCKL